MSIPKNRISNLNTDILWGIFLQNTPVVTADSLRFIDYHTNSLTTLRHSSQVCQRWRIILLESPSIWARCVELDFLDQRFDNWRELVLRRTGQSMLTIIGEPKFRLQSFLFKLLNECWNRIQHLHISITELDWVHERIINAFNRPSNTLKTLIVKASRSPSSIRRNTGQLFSNHAPSLVHLSLPFGMNFLLDITASNVFNRNMRELKISFASGYSNTDLLRACANMPLLERLTLRIDNIVIEDRLTAISPHSFNPLLKYMLIHSARLDIYAAFLGRITPHDECILHIEHDYNNWGAFPAEKVAKDVEHMHNALQLYLKPDFVRNGFAGNYAYFCVTRHALSFNCCGLRLRLESIDIPLSIFELFIDSISNFRFPQTITRLQLALDTSYFKLPTFILLFRSMDNISQLTIHHGEIGYITEALKNENLFPRLVTIQLDHTNTKRLLENKEDLMEFLRYRRNTLPVKYIDVSRVERRRGGGSLDFFNEIPELKVFRERR